MKIYTRITICMATGVVVSEEICEYNGPVGLCKGGETPEVQETEQERALTEVTKSQWDHYQTNLRPFEDKWLADLRTDAGDKAMVTGQTAAGIGTQFDKAQEGAERSMFAKNLDPSSGKFVGAMAGLTKDRAKAVSAGTTRAGQAVDDITVQNLQQAVNVGRGQAAESTADLGSIAGDAQRESMFNADLQVRRDQGDQDRSQTLGATTMSAAGFGLSKWDKGKGKLPEVSGNTKTAGSW